jgi:hypothetical protein
MPKVTDTRKDTYYLLLFTATMDARMHLDVMLYVVCPVGYMSKYISMAMDDFCAIFEVPTAVTLGIVEFWDVTPCSII